MLNREFIIIGFDGWTEWYRRPQLLAVQLSKTNRVLYVEPGPSLKKLATNAFTNFKEFLSGNLREISPSLHVYSCGFRWSIDKSFFGNYITMKIEEWYLKRIIKKLQFKNPIIGYQAPYNSVFLKSPQIDLRFYDCIDEWTGFPDVNVKLVSEIETEIIKNVNVVFATAKGLIEKKRMLNEKIYHLPNAISDIFLDMENQPHLIPQCNCITLGFVGGIGGNHTNYELIAGLLSKSTIGGFPFRIVMVGPTVDCNAEQWMQKFSRDKKFMRVGRVPYEKMPGYIKSFDICFIPWLIDNLTKYVDPIKLYEYFSVGAPVISPEWPEIKSLEKFMYFANTVEEYEDAVKEEYSKTLQERSRLSQERMAYAKKQTWSQRVNKLINILEIQ